MKKNLFSDLFGSLGFMNGYMFEPSFFSENWDNSFFTKITDTSYLLKIEVPGYEMKDLQIETNEEKMLIVSGKIEEGEDRSSFDKSWVLPNDASVENISAQYKAGILTLTIPRKQPAKIGGKKIPILGMGSSE